MPTKEHPEKTLIAYHDPRSPVTEAFRTLRTNLQFASLDKPLKSLLLTSTGPGEGKSTVAANLSIAFAQSGKQVILVDADLRRPRLHSLFSLKNDVGLTNMLLGGNGVDALQDSRIRGLRILTSGPLPPNPAELLGSGAMNSVIQALSQEADIVVYDTPPVIAVTDAAVLAPRVDGVLLVLKLGATSREAAVRAKTLLENSRGRILGIVINDVKNEASYGYYYYYYYSSNNEGARTTRSS
ncbi:MAG: CpsD/CapB family tyrosine-protein kinase [Firmicutes bacterium]|nr:CpsD/CapB family tyrosine-protein kinase [Bacillota bacterium]